MGKDINQFYFKSKCQYELIIKHTETKLKLTFINYMYLNLTFRMPYKCTECSYTAAKLWEVRKHYHKHLRMTEKPFMCRYASCEWYGLCEAEYQIHKKSAKHIKALNSSKFVGTDSPIPNPRKLVIDDRVATEVEEGELTDDDVTSSKKVTKCPSAQKHSANEVPRRCTDDRPIKRRHPQSLDCPIPRKKRIEPLKANKSKDIPKTPVRDEPYEPGPISCDVPSYQPSSVSIPDSPDIIIPKVLSPLSSISSLPAVVPVFTGNTVRPVSAEKPYPTPPQITRTTSDAVAKVSASPLVISVTPQPSVSSSVVSRPTVSQPTVTTAPVHHSPAVIVSSSVTQSSSDSTVKGQDTYPATEPSVQILKETIQNELKHVRSDNTFHGSKLANRLHDIECRMDIQNKKIIQTLERIKPKPVPEFQERLELAGHGSAILAILGKRHPHGEGFKRGCSTCEAGNKLLIELIRNTDPRIIDPFSVYMS